jgi:ABC-2 type transport system ATP-binding protein
VQRHRLEASRSLGYLTENGPLYPDMTPLELLRFFGEARELQAKELERRIETVTDQCALELVLEKPIGKLSKGLRQRVGLAQALLHDPDVLIMDEPTAGLDPNQIHDFRVNLQALRREKRKTILISTHILQEVSAVAERILFIHEGRLIFDGLLQQLRAEDETLEEAFQRLTGGAVAPAEPAAPAPEAASEPGGMP